MTLVPPLVLAPQIRVALLPPLFQIPKLEFLTVIIKSNTAHCHIRSSPWSMVVAATCCEGASSTTGPGRFLMVEGKINTVKYIEILLSVKELQHRTFPPRQQPQTYSTYCIRTYRWWCMSEWKASHEVERIDHSLLSQNHSGSIMLWGCFSVAGTGWQDRGKDKNK